MVVSGIGVAGLAAAPLSAQATPGSPGTPQAGSVVYAEDFQNVPGPSPVERLTQYTGASGEQYTADPAWLQNCNGWIAAAAQSTTAAAQIADCAVGTQLGQQFWNQSQQLAWALGIYKGESTAAAQNNYADTAFTSGNPGAGKVEFQTASNIPFTASNRFITFSADVAAINCAVSAPLLQFSLLTSTGTAVPAGGQVNGCAGGTTVSVPALGAAPAATVNATTVTSPSAVLFSGSSVGVRMVNNNGSGTGNDHTIDNIRILDVTPQLDKSFSPASVAVGAASTLTFTVTNTSELGAKDGWSFTDSLPSGLAVAGGTVGGTCSAATTAATGSSSIAVTNGSLAQGEASCTITVPVTSMTPGSYTNGPANVSTTGLNPPGDANVTFTVPTVTCNTDANIFNTGYNGNGGVLANGASDTNWQVAGGYQGFNYPNGTTPATATSLPPAGAAWAPAQVGNVVPNAWAASPYGNAQWISAQYNGTGAQNQATGSGDWYYRYQFNLDPTVNPASFALNMHWLADNSVAAVWVNGVQQSGANLPQNTTDPYRYGGFLAGAAAATTLGSNWQTGLNTIIVQIKSYYTDEGFNAQVQPSALCPQSYTVTKTASSSTTSEGSKVTYTVTVKNTGLVDYTAANPATFTDDLSGVLDDATYNGDATGGATVTASTLSWSGALAAGATQAITYSVTVNKPDTGDHQLKNAVTPGANGGSCTTAADCATTTPVASFDVAKKVDQTKVTPGEKVTYTVTVKNTGKVAYTAADPASFTDNLSAVTDDATYNGDASNGATVNGNTLSWSGPLAVGATATITYSFTVNSPDTGDGVLSNAAVPGNGGDCAPGACVTRVPDGSYTVSKTASSATVTPGGKITYTVTVKNTGAVDYTAGYPATFTDDLSKVLDDATYNGDATGGATVAGNTLSWSGPLAIGATDTITYSVTVNNPDSGDHVLTNTVVPGGNGGSCVTTGDCTTTTPIASYTTTKTASTASATPGSTVTYTVTVRNTGQVAYSGSNQASFTDDLSKVLDDAAYNGDANHGATVSGNTLSWQGDLPVGGTVTITYSVTVNNPDTGDHVLTNGVVPNGNNGGGCSTTSDCTTTTPVASYTVAKTASAAQAIQGSTITYTVTVVNTGGAAYTAANPASFNDDLSKVLDDATYNGDASGGATVSGSTLSWSGPLAVGATQTITYSVTVNTPDTGDHVLTNGVVPTGTGGGCATPGSCTTTTPVGSYTIAKTVDQTKVTPGEKVTYTLKVTNTGAIAYTATDPASLTDDLSAVTDDATYNGDATNGATVNGNTLSWSGPLGTGDTVTITYSFTVNDPDTGDKVLRNAVAPGNNGGGCDPTTGCSTQVPSGSYTVTKSAGSANVQQGGTETYTITVTNTGKVDYTAGYPVGVQDDLSKVLDDATYNGDAQVTYSGSSTAAAPTVSGNTLTWSGPLAVGETATITYSVKVNSPDTGDHELENTVTPTTQGGGCTTAGDCTTTTPIGSFTTAKTVDKTTVVPGGVVHYTITVTNTGKVDYTSQQPASFTDDLSKVTDDATYNGDASNGATVSGNTLSWSGPLPVGKSITITYSFTVKNPNTGDGNMVNVVDPGPGGACTADGACQTSTTTTPTPPIGPVVATGGTALGAWTVWPLALVGGGALATLVTMLVMFLRGRRREDDGLA